MTFPSYSEPPCYGSEREYRLDGTVDGDPPVVEVAPPAADVPNPIPRWLSIAVGASLLSAGLALVLLRGSSHVDAAGVACALGLGCLGFALGIGGLRASAAIGCALASACFVLDPSGAVARRSDERHLASPDLERRIETLQRLATAGRHDFPEVSVPGADLHAIDLSHGDLSGADFSGASLSRALLGGVYLTRARLEGADLRGADLTGALVDGSSGLAEATCDASTLLPDGWTCVGASPVAQPSR